MPSKSHAIYASDDKDLIYEGIATLNYQYLNTLVTNQDDKDLIYEGIATLPVVAELAPSPVTTKT